MQPQGADAVATPDIRVSAPGLEPEANGGMPKSQLEAANQCALSH